MLKKDTANYFGKINFNGYPHPKDKFLQVIIIFWLVKLCLSNRKDGPRTFVQWFEFDRAQSTYP